MDELKAERVRALQEAEDLEFCVWNHFSGLARMDLEDYRSEVLLAGHVEGAFVEWRIMRTLLSGIRPLANGDVIKNVEKLLASPRPNGEDEETGKLWDLHHEY